MSSKQPNAIIAAIAGIALGVLLAAVTSAVTAWSLTSLTESPVTGVLAGTAAIAIAVFSVLGAVRLPVVGVVAGLTLAVLGLICLATPLSGLTAPTDIWSLLQVGGRSLVLPVLGGALAAIGSSLLLRSRSAAVSKKVSATSSR